MADAPDLQAVTQVQQKTWSEGDFAMVAGLITAVAEELAEALDIVPGERVLDVACGSGNGAIAAARRAWGNTVGADFVPALLERGRERAAAERLEIEFVEADAQDLPFDDASFEVTMSIFGAMFAPNQEKAAEELLRMTKPGGKIGMANWVPDGGVGRMFIFRSPDHFLDFFRTYFGPTKMAFERVGADGEEALTADLRAYLEDANVAGDRALVLEPEYLQVVATRA